MQIVNQYKKTINGTKGKRQMWTNTKKLKIRNRYNQKLGLNIGCSRSASRCGTCCTCVNEGNGKNPENVNKVKGQNITVLTSHLWDKR
jgi:hypothetical protein